MRVAITGVGLCTALGHTPDALRRRLADGDVARRDAGDARDRLPGGGIAPVNVDVLPFLRRRKDRKLLPRAAWLALPAATAALAGLPGDGVGLFLGVGREPPEDLTEPALVASEVRGQLDVEALGARGLALYPPLSSLTTLPNLVLAHVAIQLGLTGPGGTSAGDEAAGLAAVVEAAWAVHEGRCAVALAGGADSLVHPGLARDLARRGLDGIPGEAAAVFRLEAADRVQGRPVLGWIEQVSCTWAGGPSDAPSVRAALGRTGAAEGALTLALALHERLVGTIHVTDLTGLHVAVCWSSPEGRPC